MGSGEGCGHQCHFLLCIISIYLSTDLVVVHVKSTCVLHRIETPSE